MSTILLVEDESAIADTVLYALQTDGFQTHWVGLGLEAIEQARQDQTIALIILDVGLPDINGFDVCKRIRQFSEIPIIFLTARNDEIDRVVGLEIGADDYMSKPFSPRELSARVKAILKRTQHRPDTNSTQTDFVIDSQRATIRFRNHVLDLTRYEFQILKLLLSQPERVFSRAQIMDHIWQSPDTSLDRAVDTHVKSLRKKLRNIDADTDPIKTHRGFGYSIQGSADEL
ncbi:MAG: two-component system response regulator CreB [Gammaproteobacteria bacterium]|nr:two-component system response regulator CreB [Gammaproteobacteria bacterium]MDH5730599.1 two-component system response regulator CreB [Gammaproteobacteria bacterium]